MSPVTKTQVAQKFLCCNARLIFTCWAGRDGGKAKPLKAPKAAEKDLSPEDLAFKAKKVIFINGLFLVEIFSLWPPFTALHCISLQAAEEKALKEAAKKMGKK